MPLLPFASAPGSLNIPELNTDPVSPKPQSAWVLKTSSGGSGGGTLKMFFGLGFPIVTVGIVSNTYKFSYRTLENSTIRTTLS